MSSHEEYPKYIVFYPVRCDKETPKSLHIVTGVDEYNFWVPKKMCEDDQYNKKQIRKVGDWGEVNVNEWWLGLQSWYQRQVESYEETCKRMRG